VIALSEKIESLLVSKPADVMSVKLPVRYLRVSRIR
jgi:hypothetical protein